jgi:transcriptional regulator with XRE-family HTH domain
MRGKREPEWQPWLIGLGATIRRAREIAGLTQHDLAVRAGTSQGGLSRLEQGRGTYVPLISVLRVVGALREIMALVPDVLDDEIRFLLDLSGANRPSSHTAIDADLTALLEAYRGLSVEQRADFVRVALVIASVLNEQTGSSMPS